MPAKDASPRAPASAASRQRFEALVRDYGRLIASVVSRVGGASLGSSRADVEQEVLLALWKQVGAEQEIRHPSSYVYRAAVRETIRVLRRERALEPRVLEWAAGGPSDRADPEREAASRERIAAVEDSLAGLGPERERAVRAHLAGFDVREIMGMYGWPYQKARNLVARGMSDLRTALRRRGIDG
jgi:RNA polymerase sigma factor (sigma-70 family)